MCGIAGIVLARGTADPALLGRMIKSLGHRGPDGMKTDPSAGFAHTRLAIIDLETGEQPFLSDSGQRLIANAEIYNYVELRISIGEENFKTKSDCEIPLVLFERRGEKFADDLRGMYAIAIQGEDQTNVYLSRDAFGIKPLYLSKFGEGMAFASEISALTNTGIIPRALNPGARDELLQQQFCNGKKTLLAGAKRILPGETVGIENGEARKLCLRQLLPEMGPQNWSEEEALKMLDDALMNSVMVHQRSDVPYGMFLSGGVDSSAILACMRELNDRPVEAFTVGFSGTHVPDERAHAERVAKAAGARFHAVNFSEDDFWNLLPEIVSALDDPTTDYAILPTYKLAGFVRNRGLKVILSGEGGDELFAGYGRYRRLLRPRWLGGRSMRRKGLFDGENILRAEDGEWRDTSEPVQLVENWSKLQQAQAEDCQNWLPNDLLIKLDRCLMSHGVEGRTPFLDPEVASVAFNLPDALKVRGGQGKYLLRRWLETKLPEAEPFNKKRGFTVPVAEWISRKARATGILVAAQPAIEDIAEPDNVRKLFNTLEEKPARKLGQMAWTLLFYALWHKHHIQGKVLEGDIWECLSSP